MADKDRNRDSYLRRKYGITLRQYDAMLARQGGGCAICGKVKDGKKALAVEHNHYTGEIRGICCSYCNYRLIGRHRDPELLRRIASYLEQGTGLYVLKRKSSKRKRKGKKCRKRSTGTR